MGVVEELIRKEANGTLSFGNYLLDAKTKKADFKFNGASYKIKTFKEITKLEKNGTLVFESVPGCAVTNFCRDSSKVEFHVEAAGDISFTLELEPSQEYELEMNGESAGKIKTNVGGKLIASLELDEGNIAEISVTKC